MTIKFVEALPAQERAPRRDLQKMLRDFMDGEGNVAVIKIDKTEPRNTPYSLYSSMYQAVRRSKYPVKVRMRGYDVYLVKI